MLARDTLLDGRYRVVELLGTGAMGSVYLALDERLSSNVAVKGTIINRFHLAEAEEQALRRAFEREAKLLANLQHETIPRVSDYFLHDGEQYLVMEFIAGEDLYEQAKKRRAGEKQFSVSQVSEWTFQLLDALEYLHTQPEEPVIHKDIKLSNLKVTARNKIKLLDFGIAKGFAGEMTRVDAGSLQMGTEEYAPLEQFLKFPSKSADTLRQALSIKHADRVAAVLEQETDARSDLYSLAATVYRLLTGNAPEDYLPRTLSLWEGSGDPITPIHELNPAVPPPVSEVLMRALRLDITARPASAKILREMLQTAWRGADENPQHANLERELQLERARREQAEAMLGKLTQPTPIAPKSFFNRASERRHLVLILLAVISVAAIGLAFTFGLRGNLSEADKAAIFSNHFAAAAAFTEQKNYDAAIDELTRIIKLDSYSPAAATALNLRGAARQKKQQFELAEADFNAANKLDAANVEVLINRAEVRCEQKSFDAATADFNAAINLKPDYDYLYEKRGACFESRQMTAEALADYNRALELDAEDTWTYARRARIFQQQNKLDQAAEDYGAIISRRPDDAGAYYNRGMIYTIQGKRALAAADLRKAESLKTVSN